MVKSAQARIYADKLGEPNAKNAEWQEKLWALEDRMLDAALDANIKENKAEFLAVIGVQAQGIGEMIFKHIVDNYVPPPGTLNMTAAFTPAQHFS